MLVIIIRPPLFAHSSVLSRYVTRGNMGAKPSTTQSSSPGGRDRPYPSIDAAIGGNGYYGASSPSTSAQGASTSNSERTRARSLSYVPDASSPEEGAGSSLGLGGVSSFFRGRSLDVGNQQAGFNSLESLTESGGLGRYLGAQSLPGNLWSLSPNGEYLINSDKVFTTESCWLWPSGRASHLMSQKKHQSYPDITMNLNSEHGHG